MDPVVKENGVERSNVVDTIVKESGVERSNVVDPDPELAFQVNPEQDPGF